MSRSEILTSQEPVDDRLLAESGATPLFLRGVYPFMGAGLLQPMLLSADLRCKVPAGHHAVLIYFRAGNASDALIYLSVVVDGQVHRYFPIGPQGALHVPLAIREEIGSGTTIEIHLAAGDGVMGTAIIDAGFIVVEQSS